MRRRFEIAALVVLAAMLAACDRTDPETAPPPPTPAPADTTAPSIPANLVGTPTSSTRVVLAWQASTDTGGSGLAGYRVYRNGGATPIASPTTNSHADTTVQPGTSYAYTVRAIDVAGNESAASNTANVTTPGIADTTPPTVPQNLTATAINSSRIDLAWQASTDTGGSGVASYQIFRNGSTTALATVSTTTYSDTTAAPATTYTYQVRATDVAGNSSGLSTPPASATTPAAPDTTPPTVPANLMATAINPTRIDLSWQASTDTGGSGVASYRIFRNGSATALATVTAPTTTYSDTSVVASTAYSYQVRAVDAAGNVSGLSTPPANATTPANPDTTPPTVPANLTATAITSSRIDLAWQASTDTGGSGVANYRIFRNGSATPLTTVTGTTHSDTSVVAATTYSYQVRAVDVAGNVSGLSNTANATTPNGPITGLDTRPSNTSCVAWNKPTAGNSIQVVRAFPQLPNFSNPVAMMQAPGDSTRWYIVEQEGYARVFNNVANVTSSSLFVDLTDRVNAAGSEQGLLGMAFHPNYPTDPRVFFSYTTSNRSRISAIRTTNGGATLDRSTEQIILEIDDPNQYHNGGNIAFSPTDGYLYIGIGDGGSANDPFNGNVGMGQRLTTMLGKMLRIDVNGTPPMGQTYIIPSSNPFAAGNAVCPPAGRSSGNCPEIFAYGFRNPWRWSFDRQTGDLWVGDVGQDAYEEVDLVTVGGNYGWRCREGAHDTGLSCGTPRPTNMIDPVAEYGRGQGVSITGGYVYRGSQTSTLQGRYIFADFASGQVFAWIPGGTPLQPTPLVNPGFNISSFGEDNDGELYVVNYGGTLHRILFQAGTGGGTVPTMLSNTGCFSGSPARPVGGLIPYDINAPFWSDGLAKERFIGLPNGTSINVQGDHDWEFPNGTVLVKNFRLGNQLIETRLLMRHPDDSTWSGYTYEWNSGATNATRLQGGGRKTLSNGQEWIFPSEAECLQCHTGITGRVLGPETAQMNRDFAYPAPGRTANQLITHSFISTVMPPYPADPQTQPTMPDPANTSADLTQRARAYLHTNCSQCHRPGSGIAQMDLRYTSLLSATNTCGVAPSTVTPTELGMAADSQLIFPADPAKSVLLNRMNRRDTHQMPRLGSTIVDTAGVNLISAWITQLTSCP